MKCPYCNTEMKKGYLQSAQAMHWGEKKKKLFICADLDKDIEVASLDWNGCSTDAWVCVQCKKLVVDLEDKLWGKEWIENEDC